MRYDPARIGVALINSDPKQLAKDRQFLAKLGFTGLHQHAGFGEARPFLPAESIQLILTGDKAGDIDGVDCIRIIKRDKELTGKAVVMVSADGHRDRVLAAISAGCGGYVLRPYAQDTFAKHLKNAWESSRPDEQAQAALESGKNHLWAGRFDEAVKELAQVALKDNDALMWFNKGLEHLRKQEFGPAIQAFNKALAQNTLFAEAYRGLAYAHKGLGDQEKHLEYLKKSADILAMQDKLDDLKELFVEILTHDPGAVNPYNTLGVRLRRSGDLSGALHAYNRALALTPEDENLHYNIAKAYLHAARPDTAQRHLERAVAINPGFLEAAEMLGSLRHHPAGHDHPQGA
jgi:tetratricopeptide (TPR) repeat protein